MKREACDETESASDRTIYREGRDRDVRHSPLKTTRTRIPGS